MTDKLSALITKLRAKSNGRQFASLFDDGESLTGGTTAEVELELCKLIALETIDYATIDAIFRESAVCRQNKWDKDGYGENIINQAISAAKASKGIPSFIVQSMRKGQTVDKVNPALLAEWVRNNVKVKIVKDSVGNNKCAYLYENGVFNEIDDDILQGHIKAPIAKYDISLVDMDTVRKVKQDLMSDLDFIYHNQLNANEDIINFENGVLDLNSMELKPHSPEYLSTIQLPCKWTGTENETPIFDKYLDTLTSGDKDIQRFLLQYMGACLSNIAGHRLKKTVILVGPGDTGKSQIKRLLERLLGDKNVCSMGLAQLEKEFGVINIRHKRLFGSADMSFASVNEVNILKQVTGGDNVNANQKFKLPVDFVYSGLSLFCTNRLPKFGGDNGPWVYERICVVNCNNVVPKDQRDKYLQDKMYAEREGIVFKAITAFHDAFKNGLQLDEPQAIIDARAAYASSNSVVSNFISDCMIESTNIPDSKCSIVSKVYQIFVKWCRINNNGYAPSKKDFMSGLAQHLNSTEDAITKRVGNGVVICGYTLSDEAKFYM